VRFVDDDVDEVAAGEFLVEARCREVHIAGDIVAVLDKDLRHQVLGTAALVRGHQVLVPVIFADDVLEMVEVFAA
jgi:hypothetical protein